MIRHVLAGAAMAVVTFSAAPVAAADVIVNEYNAVDSDAFLGGGNTDPFWGQRLGNGDDWFEVVVITDHLDMREWEFIVANRAGEIDEETFSVKLTTDDAWSDLRSGTIITISEDLGNNIGDYEPAVGRWWINVRAHPSTSGTFATVDCISPTCLPGEENWKVSNNSSQITVLDDGGGVIFGPAGEGVAPTGGVGSTEVFKLEATPDASIAPLSVDYNDGTSSTFGQPNVFGGGLQTQDFTALRSVLPFTQMTDVRINEVLSHSDPGVDWIELYNTTSDPIDVGGWFLSDSFGDLTEFQIPSPTVIPAGGHVVFDEGSFLFGLSSPCGDEVILSEAVAGVPTGVRDFMELGALENGVTYGRWPDGTGAPVRLADATQGAGNSIPLPGPVVLNEIMYHPPDPGLGVTIDPEFVELHNLSAASVDLFTDYGIDGVHAWKLTGGIEFEFSTGQTIAGGGYLVIVNFDPVAETAKLVEFQTVYGIGGSVPVVGPYSGGLGNFSDTVRLRMPDTPEADGDICGGSGNPSPFVPRVIVDEVTYSDLAPWPTAADGTGSSLERRNAEAPADDASNWPANTAGSATPGAANSTVGPPTKAQQKCVNALNKNMSRIAKTQGRESCTCLKNATRAALGGQTVAACLSSDPKAKIAKATAKTASDFGKSCTGLDGSGLPKLSFIGATDAATVNAAAIEPEMGIVFDLFGSDLDATIALSDVDADAARCQTAVAKVTKRCIDEQLKAFVTCKKNSLKSGAVSTAADLAACIGDDPKSKIAKACDPFSGKIKKEIDKRCVIPLVDLGAAFPGCSAATSPDLAACAGQSASCRACIAGDLADDLYRDCDVADDGLDNDSCP